MSPLSATLQVRLEDAQLAQLEHRANEVDRPTSALARRAIAMYLEQWDKTGKEPRRV